MRQKVKRAGPLILLLISPLLTSWVELGHLPQHPRELLTVSVSTVVIGFLVFLLYRQQARLIQLSEVDELTGLKNRRCFQNNLASEVERSQRLGTGLLLAFIDLDKFKCVNDQFGHQRGDQLLMGVAQLLKQSIRTQIDTCYRLGGDEFAVLMPIKEAAHERELEKRMTAIRETAQTELASLGVGMSIGLALLQHNENVDEFLNRADQLMYECKKQGQTGLRGGPLKMAFL